MSEPSFLLDIEFYSTKIEKMRFIVSERDGDIYYINDSYAKIDEVNRMPHYITSDYYKYSSKILTTEILEKVLLNLEYRKFNNEDMQMIKQIRRDLKLKEIL